MRILYGLAGEGLGHATRSKVVISHLISRGHKVKIAASGRAFGVLEKSFPDVVQITGLELRYVDGAVNLGDSVIHNAQRLPEILTHAGAAFAEVDSFDPMFVISDFDSFAYLYAKSRNLPILSIDNLQMITRCMHDPPMLRRYGCLDGMAPAEAFVRSKLPGCDHYIVTTFFFLPVKAEDASTTTLVPPIVREEIVRAEPTDGDHVLVYQTAVGDSRLLNALSSFPKQKFVVYGLRRDGIEGNCVLKNFSEAGFVKDLASARAVVANGGMSLLGEAIYLQKPVYSVPIREHFEQAMNAAYLTEMDYGMTSELFDADVLGRFLRCIPRLTDRMKSVPKQVANTVSLGVVDHQLAVIRATSRV